MVSSFINLLKTPKTQLGIFLALIFITAFLNNPSLKVILVFVISILSVASSDLLFLKLRNIKPFFPSAALVTGSIVGLLTGPSLAWYAPIVIGVIAMFSKNFVRFSNRHVFNPAAFGLLVGYIIFNQNISWWAVSFQQFSIFNPSTSSGQVFQFSIPFLILLSPAFVSLIRMKRYRITLSFLAIYILLNQFLNPKSSILNLITDPTILFFSIVMLVEPLTSPNNHIKQILFGVVVALLSIFVSSPIINSQLSILSLVDPLIFSLLLGNLVFFKFR